MRRKPLPTLKALIWRSRRGAGLAAAAIFVIGAAATTVYLAASEPVPPEIAERFDTLSQSGNSSCDAPFKESIATMPPDARLQGSCCSPMSLHRYSEQIAGLERFKAIDVIPPDPYDVEVGLAQRLLASYDLKLTPAEQQAFDYAMSHSEEKGPCCCKCWRWHVFGGLGKLLIHEHGFTGQQLTQVWDLSNGCGGDSHEHT